MTGKNGSSWSAAGSTPSSNEKGMGEPSQPMSNNNRSKDKDAADDESAAAHEDMKPAVPSEERATRDGLIERSLQAQLGRQLRTIFADVAEEPVPDRFVKLLEELEAREKRR